MLEQRFQLPVGQSRNDILHAINNNSVVIIRGETGSGKTTQVRQVFFKKIIYFNEVPTELAIKVALRCSLGVPQCNRVTRMPLTTKPLLCKQTIDNCRTRTTPWCHLSSNRVSFVPHFSNITWKKIGRQYIHLAEH